MEKIKFSIVVPVYGSEQYFKDCIESVLNQNYKNLELILVDDESPDNCPIICDEYANKDNRVIVIHQKNSGVSVACNAGIKKATGDYLIQLDNDDYFSENALSNIYNVILQQNNPDILQCNYKDDINGEIKDNMQSFPSNNSDLNLSHLERVIKNYAMWRYPIAFWSMAIKIDFLNKINFEFNSKYDSVQDQDAFFTCYLNTQSIYYYNYALTHHRKVDNSLSRTINFKVYKTRLDFFVSLYSRFNYKIINRKVLSLYKQIISYFVLYQISNIGSLTEDDRNIILKDCSKLNKICKNLNSKKITKLFLKLKDEDEKNWFLYGFNDEFFEKFHSVIIPYNKYGIKKGYLQTKNKKDND